MAKKKKVQVEMQAQRVERIGDAKVGPTIALLTPTKRGLTKTNTKVLKQSGVRDEDIATTYKPAKLIDDKGVFVKQGAAAKYLRGIRKIKKARAEDPKLPITYEETQLTNFLTKIKLDRLLLDNDLLDNPDEFYDYIAESGGHIEYNNSNRAEVIASSKSGFRSQSVVISGQEKVAKTKEEREARKLEKEAAEANERELENAINGNKARRDFLKREIRDGKVEDILGEMRTLSKEEISDRQEELGKLERDGAVLEEDYNSELNFTVSSSSGEDIGFADSDGNVIFESGKKAAPAPAPAADDGDEEERRYPPLYLPTANGAVEIINGGGMMTKAGIETITAMKDPEFVGNGEATFFDSIGLTTMFTGNKEILDTNRASAEQKYRTLTSSGKGIAAMVERVKVATNVYMQSNPGFIGSSANTQFEKLDAALENAENEVEAARPGAPELQLPGFVSEKIGDNQELREKLTAALPQINKVFTGGNYSDDAQVRIWNELASVLELDTFLSGVSAPGTSTPTPPRNAPNRALNFDDSEADNLAANILAGNDTPATYDAFITPEVDATPLEPVDVAPKAESSNFVKPINLTKRYHKESLLYFFGSVSDPNWDKQLEGHILSGKGRDKKDIIWISDTVISEYGKTILVNKRLSDTLEEMNELIQLQFCVLRNLHTGNRYATASVKLSDLNRAAQAAKSASAGPVTFAPAPGAPTTPPTPADAPDTSLKSGPGPVQIANMKEADARFQEAYNTRKTDFNGRRFAVDGPPVRSRKVVYAGVADPTTPRDIFDPTKTTVVKTRKLSRWDL